MVFKEEWIYLKENGEINFAKVVEDEISLIKEGENVREVNQKMTKHYLKQQKEYYKVNKDEILNKRVRLDYAFLFDFGDNDFSECIEGFLVNKYIPLIERELNTLSPYATDEWVIDGVKKYFDKEFLFETLKRGFIGEYLLNSYRHRGSEEENINNQVKEALSYIDYLFK